jgi:hypothetical protein
VKKFGLFLLPPAIALVFSFGLNSCKKTNEATELGGDLIPAVDNIHTFEAFLPVETDNQLFSDSSKTTYLDDVAIGAITNDQEFGQTQASAYFNMAPTTFGSYPFYKKDSVAGIDSIVLSLAYRTSYGDTNSTLNVHVFEIDPNADFRDTVKTSGVYPVSVPDFATTGSELGSKTFTISSLKDTITLVQKRKDTLKTANVLRIRFNSTALAERFKNDTSFAGPNATYYSAPNFYKIFKGLAVKADLSGNALGYFTLSDPEKTKLTIYYRVQKNGVTDTTSVSLVHGHLVSSIDDHGFRVDKLFSAQANVVKRTPQAGWANALATAGTTDNKLYVQSDPGSVGLIRIPALDTFSSKIIYRAELIMPRLAALQENIFTPPAALFLDKISSQDTAYAIVDDLKSMDQYGGINFNSFGGLFNTRDSSYRFRITSHVQDIISKGEPNMKLRVYLPFEDDIAINHFGSRRTVHVLPLIAYGRVILAGGNYADPSRRMRVRIVYSKVD